MAGIDKTYLKSWEQFDAVRNWAKETRIPLKNGKTVRMSDFMYYPDLTKQEWDEWHDERIKSANEHYNTPEYADEAKKWYGDDWVFNAEDYFDVVLWNTPTYVDVFLIRNCPFDFIQERLREQYGGGWSKTAFTEHNDDDMYEQIKNGTSVYDTYQRNGLGKNAHVRFSKNAFAPRDKKCWWWIEIVDSGWWYNEDDDMWYNHYELMPTTCNVNNRIHGALTKKNIVNMIRRWNLPKGIKLRFSCCLDRCGWEFTATVK